jgi:hypothetical protein
MSMKYRILITDVLGYRLHQLQKRILFIFWITVDERGPQETARDFYYKCVEKTGVKVFSSKCKNIISYI